MVAPWQEHQYRVVIEFKKGSHGARREVTLTHQQNVLPPQLYGRISPEVWSAFMNDLSQLVVTHPYLAPPNETCCIKFCSGMACLLVLGFGCFDGDAGDYGAWLSELQSVLNRHQPAFAAGGANLHIGRVHGSFWAQIDIDPRVMAVGAPVAAAYPYGYPPQQPPYPYGGAAPPVPMSMPPPGEAPPVNKA